MKKRDQYFQNPAISRGKLLPFATSPRAGVAALTSPPKDTEAMKLGRAFHSLMEGVEAFDIDFKIFDDREICEQIGGLKPRSTNQYRAWLDTQNDGREIISVGDWVDINTMVQNVKGSKFYCDTVGQSATVGYEVPFYATIDGLPFKCLADCVVEKGDTLLILDWKKTRLQLTASQRDMSWELKKWSLHFQHFHYSKVIAAATGKKVTFVFVFAEDSEPFDILPVILHPESELLIQAELLWNTSVKNYREYLSGNIFGLEKLVNDGILIIE
jgi:hypothetical protein